MAICEVHLSGGVLGKQVSARVILPEGKGVRGPFPVCYLLHGLSDDHTTWTRRTSLERYLDGLPLIVVMPNGERGWYSDSQAHRTRHSKLLSHKI
jgi:S-formylglutathione hydrolase FrmB